MATTVADFSQQPLVVDVRRQSTSLDFATELLHATGTVQLSVADFFTVSGDLAIEKSNAPLPLSDGTTVDADLLTIGGSNLSAFAGVNGGTANQTGVALGGVDFALALATDHLDGSRQWTTLAAGADSAGLVGAPGVTVTGTDLAVLINQPDGNGVVANYAAAELAVDVGGGQTVTLDMDGAAGRLLRASGNLTINVQDFFRVQGGFAIDKSNAHVTLADGSGVDVALLTVGGDGVAAFAGLNGGTARFSRSYSTRLSG